MGLFSRGERGHSSDRQIGGSSRGRVRPARDDRTAREAAADAKRIANDSFAVNTPNRPGESSDQERGYRR